MCFHKPSASPAWRPRGQGLPVLALLVICSETSAKRLNLFKPPSLIFKTEPTIPISLHPACSSGSRALLSSYFQLRPFQRINFPVINVKKSLLILGNILKVKRVALWDRSLLVSIGAEANYRYCFCSLCSLKLNYMWFDWLIQEHNLYCVDHY